MPATSKNVKLAANAMTLVDTIPTEGWCTIDISVINTGISDVTAIIYISRDPSAPATKDIYDYVNLPGHSTETLTASVTTPGEFIYIVADSSDVVIRSALVQHKAVL